MSANLVETFAVALLELSLDKKDVETFLGDALMTREIFEKHPKLERILSSHMIAESDKHQVIDKVFAKVLSKYFKNFLHVIVDKNDFSYFNEINEEFIKLATHEINAKDVYVYSVHPLPKEKLAVIRTYLEKRYKIRIFTHNIIDKSLIGGLRVVMEDITFDNTVTFQLARLRERILTETR